jgi:O-antigen ligase
LTETALTDDVPIEPLTLSFQRPEERWGRAALLVVPGALVVYMGFNAGGYFPGTPAFGVLILSGLLLLRLFLAEHPLEGLAWSAVLATAMLTVYAAVALVSGSWSHSTSRSLLSFDRDLLYLFAFVLFATLKPTPADVRWVLRWIVLGIAVVCLAGLISRVLPNVWHTAPNIDNQRLSYPVTYWNALGILATLGIILSFHLTSSVDEPWPLRVAAAVLTPLLCATLYFTFSRASMAAAVIGLIIYLLVARPRLLPGATLATAPVIAAVVYIAYRANLLATTDLSTPAAVKQAHHVALALGIGIVISLALRLASVRWLDPELQRRGLSDRVAKRTRILVLSGAGAVAVALILIFSVPSSLAHDWNQFLHESSVPTTDLRARLSNFGSNGRVALWRTAIHAFDAKPLDGTGAGTYELLWQRSEPYYAQNVNAHNLYLETMAEMGLMGLVSLVAFIGAVLVGLFRRARGTERPIYAAIGAVVVAYFLHAFVDWDWQMPVIGIGVFSMSGLALSSGRARFSGWSPGSNARFLLAVGCVASAASALMIIASQARLHAAEIDLRASRCTAATSSALSEVGWMPSRPEAYEIIGYCDLERGFAALAVQAMQTAVQKDPSNWEPHYGLALAEASAGQNPKAAAAEALSLNPRGPLAVQAVQTFDGASSAQWPTDADKLRIDALDSYQLSISPTT